MEFSQCFPIWNKLTPQQQMAVQNRGGKLLVSAAAGSGKTKVLVERLFAHIAETHCHVDDFLIISYTKAAAAELRARISSALSERLSERPGDRHLRRQLGLLGSARIQTVHAFCQSLIREHFTLCGVEPDFRLADETQRQLLLEQALQIVTDCSCPFGCPSCAGPMGEIGMTGKRTAYELLRELTR